MSIRTAATVGRSEAARPADSSRRGLPAEAHRDGRCYDRRQRYTAKASAATAMPSPAGAKRAQGAGSFARNPSVRFSSETLTCARSPSGAFSVSSMTPLWPGRSSAMRCQSRTGRVAPYRLPPPPTLRFQAMSVEVAGATLLPGPAGAPGIDVGVQRRLARRNELRLRPTQETEFSLDELTCEMLDRRWEEAFLAQERAALADTLASVPGDADAFLRWFEGLRADGPGQGDPLFPWLAREATRELFRWFLGQEVAGEAGFDDLLALPQLKMPVRAKLEMARNFWDELGRGHAAGVHGALLSHLADELDAWLPGESILP